MKLVIEGHSGSGKSTAVRRILKYTDREIWGLWSEKMPAAEDLPAPVYLHSYRSPIRYSDDNRIGVCQHRCAQSFPKVFETLGVETLRSIPEGILVLLDEIGVMESEARQFQAELFRLLDGSFDVILTIRDKSTPLLDAIRNHPMVQCVSAQAANDEAFCREAAKKL